MSDIGSVKLISPDKAIKHIETVAEKLGKEPAEAFGERVSEALKSVANAQTDSAKITKDFELGVETDISKVMVQQQISSLGFQLTLNVRNKLLGAYKDIMNMPV